MHKRVFLTNTDTTIGFISKSSKALDTAKNRASNKKYIEALPCFKSLTKRVPKKYRKFIRNSSKSTFIISKNYSFRVIKDSRHNLLLKRLKKAYSSSANASNQEYDYDYAYRNANIIVYPLKNQTQPSKIYKLGKAQLIKIR